MPADNIDPSPSPTYSILHVPPLCRPELAPAACRLLPRYRGHAHRLEEVHVLLWIAGVARVVPNEPGFRPRHTEKAALGGQESGAARHDQSGNLLVGHVSPVQLPTQMRVLPRLLLKDGVLFRLIEGVDLSIIHLNYLSGLERR